MELYDHFVTNFGSSLHSIKPFCGHPSFLGSVTRKRVHHLRFFCIFLSFKPLITEHEQSCQFNWHTLTIHNPSFLVNHLPSTVSGKF